MFANGSDILEMLVVAVETALMVLEPAYRTYKTNAETSDEDMQRLLVHWIIYATFRIIDCFFGHWFPMYSGVKLAAIVWLRASGSEKLYQSIVGPFLDDYGPIVDAWLDRYNYMIDKVVNTAAVLTNLSDMTAVEGAAVDKGQDAAAAPKSNEVTNDGDNNNGTQTKKTNLTDPKVPDNKAKKKKKV